MNELHDKPYESPSDYITELGYKLRKSYGDGSRKISVPPVDIMKSRECIEFITASADDAL